MLFVEFLRIVNLARGGSLVTCSVIMFLNHHTYHCQRRSHVRRNFNGAAAAAKASEALHEFEEEALEDGVECLELLLFPFFVWKRVSNASPMLIMDTMLI